MMTKPSVAELLEKVDNRYLLVIATAKRARQIATGSEVLVKTKYTPSTTTVISSIMPSILSVVHTCLTHVSYYVRTGTSIEKKRLDLFI